MTDGLDDALRRAACARALALAREAGALLSERFARTARVDTRSKSAARDLVSEADVASERLLVRGLREAFPAHAIQAEEETQDADDGRPRWFLDPLDGTVNFVHGLPVFCVSMALWADGRPEVAVVHAPRLGETFHAVRGGGAFVVREGGGAAPERLAVSAERELGNAILATGFPYRRNELEHDNLANFGRFFHDVRGMRRMGSAALDLAWVAAGRLDGFWELHLGPHDVAAGGLLVREAGGVVSDADGGEDWLFGGHVVAAGPGLHGAIRARVRH
jgi:myo-inositol-1(or 4)-monophosphatase